MQYMDKANIVSISKHQRNKIRLILTGYPYNFVSRIDGFLFLDMTLSKHNGFIKARKTHENPGF